MKVLALTRYGRKGASSRLRTFQFVAPLAERGIEVVPAPLLDEAFLTRRYAGRPSDPWATARAYASRAARLIRGDGWDLVWLEKESFPWMPYGLERALARYGAPLVADFDDAWFHRYDDHRSRLVRFALGAKLDQIMRGAAVVVAGNDYIADHARAAGAARIEIVPTVVEPARYDPHVSRAPASPFTIGWIGTPLTARYLGAVEGPLRTLAAEGSLRFVAVGAGALAFDGVPTRVERWDEASEAASIAAFDVGIMPLPDSPWERGKCGYKLIQCMAAGKPVVASPVGVNRILVRDGENGFLAEDEAGWLRALRALRDDPDRRAAMGAVGRRLVEEQYSVAAVLPRLAAILRDAAR